MKQYPLPATFDHTMLNTFLGCPQKFFWAHIRELRKAGTGTAADFGAWVHDILATYYTHVMKGEEKGPKLMARSIKESPQWNEPADLLDALYTQATGEFILMEYAKNYQYEKLAPLAVEQSFAIPIDNLYLYLGRIDIVGLVDDILSVIDHKTTKRLGKSFLLRVSPNRQGTGYIYAARQYFDGLSHFVLNGIRVTANRDNPGYRRTFPANRIEYDVERWLRDTNIIVSQIFQSYDRRNWVQNTDACADFGDCPYRPLCMMRQDPYELRPPHSYEHHRWEPYKGAKTHYVEGTD